MRILILAPYPPYPPRGGGAQRIFQLVRGLSQRHELTCLTFAPDAAAAAALEPLRRHCRLEVVIGPARRSLARRALTTVASPLPDMALRNASRAFAHRLGALCAAQQFDLVQAESIEMARYVHSLPDGPMRSRRVLDEFNAEYLLQRRTALTSLRSTLGQQSGAARARHLAGSAYSLVQWRKLASYERAMLPRYDAALVVSEEDRRALARIDPWARTFVVPNGVDCSHFAPVGGAPAGATIVFTGTMDYRPNIDAARWFVAEVLPRIRARRPDVTLRLVGRAPAPQVLALAAATGVVVTGEVADVRPEIGAAAVYVVPMRIGGGVRLKLLEALAMEAPVVSTTMGVEGVVGLSDETHCLIADDGGAFAAAVLRLLDDRTLARRLGAAGRAFVAQRYDWSAIIPLAEDAYQALRG